jgi:hypothetical protein
MRPASARPAVRRPRRAAGRRPAAAAVLAAGGRGRRVRRGAVRGGRHALERGRARRALRRGRRRPAARTSSSPGRSPRRSRTDPASRRPAASGPRRRGRLGRVPSGSACVVRRSRTTTNRPCPELRGVLELPAPVASGVLHLTAGGIYRAWLNGVPAARASCCPGFTDYRLRIPYETYDVTGLLQRGENVLTAEVADGWWSGYLGFTGVRGQFGELPVLRAVLDVRCEDGSRHLLRTGRSGAGGSGQVVAADLQRGQVLDLRRPGSRHRRRVERVACCRVLPARSSPRVRPRAGGPARAAVARTSRSPACSSTTWGSTSWAAAHPAGRRGRSRGDVAARRRRCTPDGTLYTQQPAYGDVTDTVLLAGQEQVVRAGAPTRTASATPRSAAARPPSRRTSRPWSSRACPRDRLLPCSLRPAEASWSTTSAAACRETRRRPDRLPAAGRAARLDRGRAGVRPDPACWPMSRPSSTSGSTTSTTRSRRGRLSRTSRRGWRCSPTGAPAGAMPARSCRGSCGSTTATAACWSARTSRCAPGCATCRARRGPAVARPAQQRLRRLAAPLYPGRPRGCRQGPARRGLRGPQRPAAGAHLRGARRSRARQDAAHRRRVAAAFRAAHLPSLAAWPQTACALALRFDVLLPEHVPQVASAPRGGRRAARAS